MEEIISTSDRSRLRPSDLKDDDELDETWRIGKCFEKAPQEERIHIVVKAPEPISVESKLQHRLPQ